MSWWQNDPHALRTKAEELIRAGVIGWSGTSSTGRVVDQMHWDAAMGLLDRANRIDSEHAIRTQ